MAFAQGDLERVVELLGLEGFTLLDGAVSVQVGGGNASVTLRGFDITNLTQSSIGPGGGANSDRCSTASGW